MDLRLGEAALAIRDAFDKVDNIYNFCQNNPSGADPETTDPLIVEFGYTADEAYLVRVTFETLKSLKTNNDGLVTNLSKMTGLD
jgi:hypothetical protein